VRQVLSVTGGGTIGEGDIIVLFLLCFVGGALIGGVNGLRLARRWWGLFGTGGNRNPVTSATCDSRRVLEGAAYLGPGEDERQGAEVADVVVV
jgi:hypothetical protein